jgi:hypothetical protein
MSKGWLTLLLFSGSLYGGCDFGLGGSSGKGDRNDDDDDDDDDDGGGKTVDGDDDDDDDDDKPGPGDDDDDDDAPGGDCQIGVDAFCVCIVDYFGYECTDPEQLLDLCRNGEDYGLFECLAGFVDTSGYINCYDAFSVCYY